MIIKKLILKSFGKFQSTSIDLKSGINIIVGDNESGKSTTHQFIEGLFYGFYKQNIKNKKRSETYERYLPWDNARDYSGVMLIEDGKELRIERNFMKDSVHVFDNTNGQDITESYPYDTVTKTNQPALVHLGLNLVAYQNTVSIAQMKNKTTDELIMEIKNNIINLGETKTMDVSIHNIMRIISEKKTAIGTERSKKSNYGKIKETISLMESEKIDTDKIWEDVKNLKIQENDWIMRLKELEKNKHNIEKKMYFLKTQDSAELFQKVMQVKEELIEIENKLNTFRHFETLSKDEINEALIKQNSRVFLDREQIQEKEKIQELEEKLLSMDKEITDIDNVIIEIGASEKLSRDVYRYEEFENSKKYVGQTIEPEQLQILMNDRNKSSRQTKAISVFFVLTSLLVVLLGLVSVLELMDLLEVESPYTFMTWGATGLMLFITCLLGIRRHRIKSGIKDLDIQINTAKGWEDVSLGRIKEIDERQTLLLNTNACDTIEALRVIRDKKIKEELMYEDNFNKARQLEADRNRYQNRLSEALTQMNDLTQKMQLEQETIQHTMNQLDAHSEVELREALEQYDAYRLLQVEKSNKEGLLAELTRGKSYMFMDAYASNEEDVETGSPLVDQDQDQYFETIEENYDELEEALKRINENIVEVNKTVGILNSSILLKENKVRKPALIEEELNQHYEALERLNFKLNTFNLIEEAIESISKNIQDNFVPTLNEKISKIVGLATDYKYTEVKVNAQMEITVVDQELNKLVNANDLSSGTIDLMYFALRISLAEIINNGKNVPILLDDSFVQYDERRLIKMLEYLTKLDRQIILFTCHKRELKVIKRIVEDAHVVNL